MYNFIKVFFICMVLSSALTAQNLIDGVAAVVGKEIILKSEIEQHVNNYLIQNRINRNLQPEVVQSIQDQTLQSLIEQKLMLAIAERDTITVDPELLDQRLEQRIRYLIDRVGSEDQLEKTFRSSMKMIRKDTRKILEEQILVEKVRQEKFKTVKVSRREVQEFYKAFEDSLPGIKESVEISHILKLVTPSQDAQNEAYQKVVAIKKMVDEGKDFDELAKEYSQDPASAKRGGDLGLISRGDFVKEYEAAAFALSDGEVSDIVQTQFGYHIIKMIERRGEKIRTQHILIQVAPNSNDEQRTIQQLNEIRKMAMAGQPFDSLALEYSDDENVKTDKGRLGIFETDQLVIPQFQTVVAQLKEGEISEPFKTDYGYHIVYLAKRMPARKVSLENDWQKLEEMATNFKTNQKYFEWIKTLKEQVPIEIKS